MRHELRKAVARPRTAVMLLWSLGPCVGIATLEQIEFTIVDQEIGYQVYMYLVRNRAPMPIKS